MLRIRVYCISLCIGLYDIVLYCTESRKASTLDRLDWIGLDGLDGMDWIKMLINHLWCIHALHTCMHTYVPWHAHTHTPPLFLRLDWIGLIWFGLD